ALRGGVFVDTKLRELRDDIRVVPLAVVAVGFDLREHLANRVHRRQQHRGDRLIQHEVAVAKLAEQLFARMGQGLEFREIKKSRDSFDRVNGSKNAPQQIL